MPLGGAAFVTLFSAHRDIEAGRRTTGSNEFHLVSELANAN